MTRILIPAILILASAVVAVTQTSETRELDQSVRALLAEYRDDYGFPGATAAYVMPDGTVGTVAVGVADRETGETMKPAHRMLAASIGKTIWGALVLALESDGLLLRSDPVSDHLGHLPWFERLPNAASISVGDLVSHRSGLPDHVHMEGVASAVIDLGRFDAFAPEEAIAFVLDEPALFDAGAGWAYSDTGYLVLGLVIEAATGQDVFVLAQERFLAPLALTRTEPSNRRNLEELAVGYTVEGNPFGLPARTSDSTGTLEWNPAIEWTGGGFASTSEDLAIWGHALFTGEVIDAPYLSRLLQAVPVHPDVTDVLYGSGVAIYTETPFGLVYGHAGWIPGYVSSLRHYADHQVTIAFQINTDRGSVDDSTDLVPALEAALAELLTAAAADRREAPPAFAK